jgi:hypothetical protein
MIPNDIRRIFLFAAMLPVTLAATFGEALASRSAKPVQKNGEVIQYRPCRVSGGFPHKRCRAVRG